MKKSLNLSRHILHTAIVTTLLAGAQNTLAGNCVETLVGKFNCFGAANQAGEDPEIKITTSNPTILTTVTGFGVDASKKTTDLKYRPAINVLTTKGVQLIDNHNALFKSHDEAILIENKTAGDVTITTNGTIISTNDNAIDISNASGSIDITVNNVSTLGSNGKKAVKVDNTAKTGHLNITTHGIIDGSNAISATHKGDGAVTIITNGPVSASALNKYAGIYVDSLGSPINITINNRVEGAIGVKLNTRTQGTISNKYTLPAASPATITNNGELLSFEDVTISSENLIKVQNNSRVMGSIKLSTVDDQIDNGVTPVKYGSDASKYGDNFDLRKFLVIKQGVRTRHEKSVNDFSEGNDTFNNNKTGFLRLATVPDANNFTVTTDDNTAPTSVSGKYTISGTSVTSYISTVGVEHALLVNLENFNNAGTITMADTETGGTEAVSGDVLVITSRGTALSGTPEGIFTSNGGELHIDTLLNDGATDSSDVLVIDKSVLGTGPTKVTVHNTNGTGADTGTGNTEGILVIRVLGDSDANAFVLAKPVEVGNHQYHLVQADGKNWYLQSSLKNNSTLTLAADKVTGTAGNMVMLPIQLGSNDAVAGMQFDATFNASVLSVESLLNGADIGSASVTSSAIGTNTYRVNISAANGNNINNGELVKLNFKINAQAGNGTYPIDINNIQLTDTNAATLTFDATNIQAGSIKVGGVNSSATLDIPDITGHLSQTIKLPISLANNDNVVGMQFDVVFDGGGFSVVNHVNGADSGAATINANAINANTYRFLITDLNLNNLNNGVLANLNLKIDANATLKDYNITLANTTFANANGGTVTVANIGSAVIKVDSSIFGDSNGDNQVNVNDIIALVKIILTSGTSQNGSDCNNDGNTNVNDIICAINLILKK